MQIVSILGILITFLIIFYFIYEKDRRDRERVDTILKAFENTIANVLISLEKTNNKFYEMVGKTEIEHFKTLDKFSDRQIKFMDKQSDSFQKTVNQFMLELNKVKDEEVKKIEKIGGLDTARIENIIEREDNPEIPLSEMPRIPIVDGINVRMEDEEQVYPINIE